ncbi:hypothetical protein Tco_0141098, partial [Tanacetum coccineum]
DMVTAKIPCWKVLDDKAKKKRKADEKAMAHAADADIQADKVVTKRGAGKEDVRKRKRVQVGAPVQQGAQENVDAAFANEGHGDNEGPLLETAEMSARDKAVPEVEA